MSNTGCRDKRDDNYGAPSGPILSVAPSEGISSSGLARGGKQYQQNSGTNGLDFGDSLVFGGAQAIPISDAFENFDVFGPNSGFLTEFTDNTVHSDFATSQISSSTFDSSGFTSQPNNAFDRGPSDGRQFNQEVPNSPKVTGGVDFNQATRTADGRLCVIKDQTVDKVSKTPILECTHKNVEQCHYTYITNFKPVQQEVCEENYEKLCQITYNKKAIRETVKKCYRPTEKVCNGQGEDMCSTVYESACTTRYVEKQPGKFVGDTGCEKQPIEICGAGCVFEEGEEECHEKEIDTVVDVPEESCDLNPQKTCRLATKLVPSLTPKHECTQVPKETCNLKFSSPEVTKGLLKTEWCLDETPAEPGQSYGDNQDDGLQTFARNQKSYAEPSSGSQVGTPR